MRNLLRVFAFPVLLLPATGCRMNQNDLAESKTVIKAQIDSILKIQEDAYNENTETARQRMKSTCSDSLVFIGGDDGGQVESADFYVHDLADGYSKKPSDKTYRIFSSTVIVTSVYQSFKLFGVDTIFFNGRSTKVFVKENQGWKMAYVSYAPLPVMYQSAYTPKPSVLSAYEGLYRESDTVTDTVIVENGKLYLAVTGASRGELIPLNDSSFYSRGYFGRTVFSTNNKKQVTHSYYEFPDGQRLVFPRLK